MKTSISRVYQLEENEKITVVKFRNDLGFGLSLDSVRIDINEAQLKQLIDDAAVVFEGGKS